MVPAKDHPTICKSSADGSIRLEPFLTFLETPNGSRHCNLEERGRFCRRAHCKDHGFAKRRKKGVFLLSRPPAPWAHAYHVTIPLPRNSNHHGVSKFRKGFKEGFAEEYRGDLLGCWRMLHFEAHGKVVEHATIFLSKRSIRRRVKEVVTKALQKLGLARPSRVRVGYEPVPQAAWPDLVHYVMDLDRSPHDPLPASRCAPRGWRGPMFTSWGCWWSCPDEDCPGRPYEPPEGHPDVVRGGTPPRTRSQPAKPARTGRFYPRIHRRWCSIGWSVRRYSRCRPRAP